MNASEAAMRSVLLTGVLALAGCAAGQPSPAQARDAMLERMQASARFDTRVQRIHSLDLAGCVPATGADGVVCEVVMDVSFEIDGKPQRSSDAGPMRFVREDGVWKAYPTGATAPP